MPEEPASYPGTPLDTSDSPAHPPPQSIEVFDGGIGQGGGVQMRPELLDWIQFGGVGGEPLHGEPRAVACEGRAGEPAAVGREPIPQ